MSRATSSVPVVTVVVPYYRDADDLDRLAAALARQTYPAERTELVVADDGSPTPPRLPELPFPARVVRQEDRGFRASAARDLGARAASGDVLAFLDGDMIPESGYLAAAVAALGRGADVVVGRRRHLDPGALRDGWRPGDPVPAAAVLPEPAWLANGYRATRNLTAMDSTGYRYVISAVLSVRAEVYREAGGFDPSFVGYGGEDWELAYRLWRCGADLAHAPDAVAWHRGPDVVGRAAAPGEAGADAARGADTVAASEAARDAEVAARAAKNAESLRLAPLIAAPTARGRTLALGHAPRVALTLDARGADAAAAVLCVDALLGAFPAARLAAVGDEGSLPGLETCAADPRVDVAAWPPTAMDSTRTGLDAPPDWRIDVLACVRPRRAGDEDTDGSPAPVALDTAGPRAAAEALLLLERHGWECVEVVDDDGAVARLTSIRATARQRRGGEVPTRRLPLARTGWERVRDADLEAWWGGWG